MFIVFEGGEGVGKSTQIETLYQVLQQKNISCVKTREPGGTPIAEKIRTLFKEKNEESLTELAEIFLICAARTQHIEKVIRPNLKKNKIILCDRFLDSTYVYQSFYGKIPKETINLFTNPILNGLVPNLTFVFHCNPKISALRMQKEEHRQADRFDTSSSSFHGLISQSYKEIVDNKFPYPCGKVPHRVLIDASQTPENVFEQIKNSFFQVLNIQL